MSFEFWTIFLGGVSTLAIFSFVIKENPYYRFFEHFFIGISAGFGIMLTVQSFIWPRLLVPILGLDIDVYPDGTLSKPYNYLLLIYLVPIAFGGLYYFIFSTKHSWLAKLAIGFSLGISGGMAFEGFFNEMLPQITSSFKPLLVTAPDQSIVWGKSLNNMAFVVTMLLVMYYFFFTFKRGEKVSGSLSTSGRFLMMICFGAFFGSTVMARMSLLVERLLFLYEDWYQAIIGLFS